MRPVAQNGHHWLTENNLRLEAEGALNLPSSPPPPKTPRFSMWSVLIVSKVAESYIERKGS